MNKGDTKQILDGLYKYITSIDIGGIPWFLEYLRDNKSTSLLFKQTGLSNEVEMYLGGSYKAELPFEVYIQASARDTKKLLDMPRILNTLAEIFKEEEENGFPNLKLDDAIPISLEMVTLPADYSGDTVKLSSFSASFKLTYEKKGKFA